LITPFATVTGAIIGIGAGLLAERLRWHRDKEKDRIQKRREVYPEFLMALSQSHSNMRSAVLQNGNPLETASFGALHEALDGSGIWRFRQSLSLTAPAEIIKLAVDTCSALTKMKDVLVERQDVTNDAYLRARADLWRINADLREAMRRDLGMNGPPDPDVGRYYYPTPP